MKTWNMNVDSRILRTIGEFLFLAFLSAMVPVLVATDIRYFSTGFSEMLVTELAQEAFLGIAAVLFAIQAWKRPASRGFLVLVAGLFFTMLIRELDAYLDKLVYHSFWVWPALFVAISAIGYAWGCKGAVAVPIANFIGTKSQLNISFGFLTLLVFSRTMGSGGLWKHLAKDSDWYLLKTAIQEGLELFAYIFICYGSWQYTEAALASQSSSRPRVEST
jgi:hypothetical protein